MHTTSFILMSYDWDESRRTAGQRIATYIKSKGKPLNLLRRSKDAITTLEYFFQHEFQTEPGHRGWQTQFVDWVLFSKNNSDGSYEADFSSAKNMMFAICYLAENGAHIEHCTVEQWHGIFHTKVASVLKILSNYKPQAWIQDKVKFFNPHLHQKFNYWNGTSNYGKPFSAFNHSKGHSRAYTVPAPRARGPSAPVLPAQPRGLTSKGTFPGLKFRERPVDPYWIPRINEIGFLLRMLKNLHKSDLAELQKKLSRAGVNKKVLKVLNIESDDDDYGNEEFYAALDVDDNFDDLNDLAEDDEYEEAELRAIHLPEPEANLPAEEGEEVMNPFMGDALDDFFGDDAPAPPRGQPVDVQELQLALADPQQNSSLMKRGRVDPLEDRIVAFRGHRVPGRNVLGLHRNPSKAPKRALYPKETGKHGRGNAYTGDDFDEIARTQSFMMNKRQGTDDVRELPPYDSDDDF